jgi:hypothetical protein
MELSFVKDCLKRFREGFSLYEVLKTQSLSADVRHTSTLKQRGYEPKI